MNLRIALIVFFIAGSSSCRNLPRLDPDKIYQDSGTILRRVGDANCWIEVITDNHGLMNTEFLDYEECHRWQPGKKVTIEIHDARWIRIIRPAAQ